ncbi:hypothetical protein ACFQPG_00840 [Sphingomonas sp. GCM10030256]|uniref:hypothetical protein n=1 Tax=Sphingomonas sp. GCM10030256 TaxID=3273427 RepID=UPI00360B7662
MMMQRGRLSLAAAIMLFSTACAHIPQQCAPAPLSLHCRAAAGDKHAQLQMGIFLDERAASDQDLRRAVQLYKAAASSSSGTTYVYSPPIGKEKAGRVLPVRTGPDLPGLTEAKVRLARMYLIGRGVRPDRRKAISLLIASERQGSVEANQQLERLRRY